MSTIIGRVRPVFRGEWDPAAAYAALDTVRSADGLASYTALKDVPAGTALSDAAYWDRIVDMTSSAARPLPATAAGNPAQIWPDAGSALRPVTTLAPVQSGSGDPSPDNVRPISGWTGAKLTRCGKNLLNHDLIVGNLALSTSDGTVYVSSSGNYFATEEYIPIVPGVNVALSQKVSIAFYDSAKQFISGGIWKAPDNAAYFRIDVHKDYRDVAQVEIGSTATEYEPYQGDAYAADFGQTVYGGTLDWNTGILTVTHGQIAAYAGESLPGAWISDRDGYAAGAMPTVGAQVVYELATPTTLQLTPRRIAALPGLNTLFTDGDGLSVGYNKSIARMFEEVLALIPAASGA